MSTEKIINQAQNGCKESLTLLLLNNKSIVVSVAQRFLFDHEQIEDIVQTIFAKVINKIKQFNGACRFSTWIYRIAVNECMDFIRKKTRRKQHFLAIDDNYKAFPDINSPDAIAKISDKELKSSIQQALKQLPLDQKTVFSLYYFGNYSGKEVAEALNITEANVFMKLKAARDLVKEKLIKQGWHL